MFQDVDFDISHHQIQIRSLPFREENIQWNDKSIEQGVLVNKGHIIFDPIVDGSFSARILIKNVKKYKENLNALRAIVVPFEVFSLDELNIASVLDNENINIGIENGLYNIYFEVCESEDVDEVYYVITFLKSEKPESKFLKDDDFGGEKNRKIHTNF